jgi:hypothetical protein
MVNDAVFAFSGIPDRIVNIALPSVSVGRKPGRGGALSFG